MNWFKKQYKQMTTREKVVTGVAGTALTLAYLPSVILIWGGYVAYKNREKIFGARKLYKMTKGSFFNK